MVGHTLAPLRLLLNRSPYVASSTGKTHSSPSCRPDGTSSMKPPSLLVLSVPQRLEQPYTWPWSHL